jgi:hypothetical protein
MKLEIRAIAHHPDEYEMGNCWSWSPVQADVFSTTFNSSGFTPMTSVLRGLGIEIGAAELDRLKDIHTSSGFRVERLSTTARKVLTTSRTRLWSSFPDATRLILDSAEESGATILHDPLHISSRQIP